MYKNLLLQAIESDQAGSYIKIWVTVKLWQTFYEFNQGVCIAEIADNTRYTLCNQFCYTVLNKYCMFKEQTQVFLFFL